MKKLYYNIQKQIIELKQRFQKINKHQLILLLLGYSYLSTQMTIILISSNSIINKIITPTSYFLKKYPSLEFFLLYPKRSFLFFQIIVEFFNFISLFFYWNISNNNSIKKRKEKKIINFLLYSYRQLKRGILLGIFIEAFKLGS